MNVEERLSNVESRLAKIEKDLKWVREWLEVLVKAYYCVSSLDEIPLIHKQIKKMPSLEETPTGVA